MATLFKVEKQQISLPPVREVSLLTVAEFDQYGSEIPMISANWELTKYSDYFYLQDEAEDGQVYFAKPQSDYGTDEPDYYDDGPEDTEPGYGTGTRPVIRFAAPIPGAAPGDRIQIFDSKFTVLAPDLIILDTHISTDVFDDFSNVYAESEIKERVDNWYEENIQPYLDSRG